MSVVIPSQQNMIPVNKSEMARKVQETDAQAGIIYDPTMTHQKLRSLINSLMAAQGIRAEDNIGSRELLQIRDGAD